LKICHPLPAAQLAQDYKLKDGTAISISELVAGGTVTINGQAAADGDYELEDGTMISVAGGAITAIAPGAMEAPATDFSAKFGEIDAKFTAYEQKFAGYEQRIAAAEDVIKKQQEINKQLFEVVEKLAEVPVENTPELPRNNFSSQAFETREEKLKGYSAALKKIKQL
jgi:ribosomal protein S4